MTAPITSTTTLTTFTKLTTAPITTTTLTTTDITLIVSTTTFPLMVFGRHPYAERFTEVF